MQNPQNPNEPPFYIVSMGKFAALFIATFGFYSLYWFYKHWSLIGKRQQRNTLPVLRAVFYIFFVPQLAKELSNYQKSTGATSASSYTAFSLGYIALTLISVAMAYAITEKLAGIGILWLQLPLLLFQFYLTYQFQLAVNASCGDPFGRVNQRFSLINHVWIVIGLILWFDKIKLFYLIATGQIDQIDDLGP